MHDFSTCTQEGARLYLRDMDAYFKELTRNFIGYLLLLHRTMTVEDNSTGILLGALRFRERGHSQIIADQQLAKEIFTIMTPTPSQQGFFDNYFKAPHSVQAFLDWTHETYLVCLRTQVAE